ncbi:hypothetical protein EDD18DRAFT_1406507 [Armillaria luteobubalina]|uniref:Uncharacterized protein n=1 Tax=Armillaria luteobubalina TaxID=153913 RepID=A0AA39TKY0_9AGAR|nr:hypothetical protein EDD18DRAFT_1406507 [Armillaria luteobubalina]
MIELIYGLNQTRDTEVYHHGGLREKNIIIHLNVLSSTVEFNINLAMGELWWIPPPHFYSHCAQYKTQGKQKVNRKVNDNFPCLVLYNQETGEDIYGLSAVMLVHTARLLSHPNHHHNPHPTIMKNIGGLLGKKSIETVIVPLEFLKAASGAIPIPALAPATEVLLSILNLAYQTQENADTRKEIVTRCVRAHATISRHLGSMEITTDILKNIERFERDLKDVWESIEKEIRKNRFTLLFYSKSKKDELQHLVTRFEDTLQLFQIDNMLSLREAVECLKHDVVEITKSIPSFPPTTEVGCDSTLIPIYSGRNHALHTAKIRGRCVVMKVFKSNPHIPGLIAISSVDDPVHFSVYDFHETIYVAVSLESFILSSVGQGLRETFKCGIKLVYGISASNDYVPLKLYIHRKCFQTGLDHLSEQGVSLADVVKRGIKFIPSITFYIFPQSSSLIRQIGMMPDCQIPTADINADEVHIFWDTNGRAIVTMDSDLLNKPRVPSPFTGDNVSRSLAVLDSVLSRPSEDNLDRSGGDEDNPIYLQAFQTEATDTQMETEADEMWNMTCQPSTSGGLQSMTPAVKPRRELVWKASYGHTSSVQKVAQQYQCLVDLHSQSSLLHQYRNLSTPQTYHRCKGYSREEVTLTHTAFDSKIVHQYPAD